MCVGVCGGVASGVGVGLGLCSLDVPLRGLFLLCPQVGLTLAREEPFPQCQMLRFDIQTTAWFSLTALLWGWA